MALTTSLKKMFGRETQGSYTQIHNGDILLFRCNGFIGWLIAKSSGGIHSHVALAKVVKDKIFAVEMREMIGGRSVELFPCYSGNTIDVLRPIKNITLDDDTIKTYDSDCAIKFMETLDKTKYSWAKIWHMLKRRLIIWRWLIPTNVDKDMVDMNPQQVCSTAICVAIKKCFQDPCPFIPDDLISPPDIARSSILNYKFTVRVGGQITNDNSSVNLVAESSTGKDTKPIITTDISSPLVTNLPPNSSATVAVVATPEGTKIAIIPNTNVEAAPNTITVTTPNSTLMGEKTNDGNASSVDVRLSGPVKGSELPTTVVVSPSADNPVAKSASTPDADTSPTISNSIPNRV